MVSSGGLVIDIRPTAQRAVEGSLPGALVVERNVLEWRLDPTGPDRLPEVTGLDQPVVVVCSAGYASSLAAESLRALGYRQATDLAGGFLAWSSWAHPGRGVPREEAAPRRRLEVARSRPPDRGPSPPRTALRDERRLSR